MKRLKFKKWVTYTLTIVLALALFLLLTVEFEDLKTEFIFGMICVIIIGLNGTLLSIYG